MPRLRRETSTLYVNGGWLAVVAVEPAVRNIEASAGLAPGRYHRLPPGGGQEVEQ